MKIDVLSNSTVKITLTRLDMKDYDVRYENLSRKSPDTKKLLSEVLKVVSLESDMFFDANADRLFIEAFPRSDGGCMLYISSLEEEERAMKPKKNELVSHLLTCHVEGVDNLAKLCSTLCSQKAAKGIEFTSSLYGKGSKFRLIVSAESGIMRLEAVLKEYGTVFYDDLSAASAREHYTEISAENAAEVISSCIG